MAAGEHGDPPLERRARRGKHGEGNPALLLSWTIRTLKQGLQVTCEYRSGQMEAEALAWFMLSYVKYLFQGCVVDVWLQKIWGECVMSTFLYGSQLICATLNCYSFASEVCAEMECSALQQG
eukprot:scaffold30830_cov19-Tisochrysis_lutea.AAC.1